ncbi:MAG: hypothetical protein AB7F23_10530 [Phycisphaerae bacterium]
MEKQITISMETFERLLVLSTNQNCVIQNHANQNCANKDYVERLRKMALELNMPGTLYYPDIDDQKLIETLDMLKQGGYIKHRDISAFIHYIADMLED